MVSAFLRLAQAEKLGVVVLKATVVVREIAVPRTSGNYPGSVPAGESELIRGCRRVLYAKVLVAFRGVCPPPSLPLLCCLYPERALQSGESEGEGLTWEGESASLGHKVSRLVARDACVARDPENVDVARGNVWEPRALPPFCSAGVEVGEDFV